MIERCLDHASVIILPLRDIYEKHKDLSLFFQDLTGMLSKPDALESLKTIKAGLIEKYWSWLGKYVEIKPSFFGFSADVNKMITDLLSIRKCGCI